MKTVLLITNIHHVTLRGLRLETQALLLELDAPERGRFDEETRQVRGFATSEMAPVFSLPVRSPTFAVVDDPRPRRNNLVGDHESERIEIVRMTTDDLDIQSFAVDETNEVYTDIWEALRTKTLKYLTTFRARRS